MHSETRQASLGHEILRILILKRIWQCKLQQIIIKSFLLRTKKSHQNDARGTLLSFHLLFCYRRHHENSEHHTLGTQHRTMAPLLPLRLPASDGGTFHWAQIFEWNTPMKWRFCGCFKQMCDVSNSSYFDLTTWNSHGFEIKRPWYCPLFLKRHPFLLPSVSGKDEIAIAIASPVFLTCAWLTQVQSIFGWYFQCLNELKFDVHNQSTVVKQSNKDKQRPCFLDPLCSETPRHVFFLDGESKINQDERGIEDKQEHRTVSLSYILRVHSGSCRKSSLQSKCRWVKSQRENLKITAQSNRGLLLIPLMDTISAP